MFNERILKFAKMNFVSQFFFSLKTSSPVDRLNSEKTSHPSFHQQKLAILKFLSSLFSYISCKLCLGCKISFCFGTILMRT